MRELVHVPWQDPRESSLTKILMKEPFMSSFRVVEDALLCKSCLKRTCARSLRKSFEGDPARKFVSYRDAFLKGFVKDLYQKVHPAQAKLIP